MFLFSIVLIFAIVNFNYATPVNSHPGVASHDIPIPRGYTEQEYIRSSIDYWTPERLASAKPLHPVLTSDYRAPIITNTVSQRATTETLLTPSVPPRTKAPVGPPAAGKVFFSMGSSNYMCSGSSVNSENRATVITAGHCVYNNTGKDWAKNFVFIPHYEKGSRPLGTFPARTIATTDGWMAKTDYNNDVAVVVVHKNENDKELLDLAGGFGILLDAPIQEETRLFGFPANNENGELMTTCNGLSDKPSRLVSMLTGGFSGIQVTCGMNGGSSGGPWVRNLNPETGSASQISVTSFGSSLAPGVIHGPLFQMSNIGNIYNFARSL